MRFTDNYNLPLVDGTDPWDFAQNNEAFNIIDSALVDLSTDVTEAVASVNATKTQIEEENAQFREEMNETLDNTVTTLENDVENMVASMKDIAPIVAGTQVLPDNSGVAQYNEVSYRNPKLLTLNAMRYKWFTIRPKHAGTGPDDPTVFYATLPYNNNMPNAISLIQSGLYKIDIQIPIEFDSQTDGLSAKISLVENAEIESGGVINGTYIQSVYKDINGSGRDTIHFNAFVNKGDGTKTYGIVCEIVGGTGSYNLIREEECSAISTITKVS